MNKYLLTVLLASVSLFAQAQTETAPAADKAAELRPAPAAATSAAPEPGKKMVESATINLRTTVTGSQEQPRVLYILPWQSPTTTNVDFESLDNEQKAVFGHVEREELRRELESSDAIQ